jgi:hypothetical protein
VNKKSISKQEDIENGRPFQPLTTVDGRRRSSMNSGVFDLIVNHYYVSKNDSQSRVRE